MLKPKSKAWTMWFPAGALKLNFREGTSATAVETNVLAASSRTAPLNRELVREAVFITTLGDMGWVDWVGLL